jgi:hypothetical protein
MKTVRLLRMAAALLSLLFLLASVHGAWPLDIWIPGL